MRITKDMTIEQVVQEFPETIQFGQVTPTRAPLQKSMTHLATTAVPLGRPDLARQNGAVLERVRYRAQSEDRWLRWQG